MWAGVLKGKMLQKSDEESDRHPNLQKEKKKRVLPYGNTRYGKYTLSLQFRFSTASILAGFPGSKKDSLGYRRAVEASIHNPLTFDKTCLIQHGQENLSWYGPTLSPCPVFNHGFGIGWQVSHQNLIGQQKASRWLQNPEDFS